MVPEAAVIDPWPVPTSATCTVPVAIVASVTVIARAVMLLASVQVIVSVVAICVLRTQYHTDTTAPSPATPSVSVFSVAFVQTFWDPEALSARDE